MQEEAINRRCCYSIAQSAKTACQDTTGLSHTAPIIVILGDTNTRANHESYQTILKWPWIYADLTPLRFLKKSNCEYDVEIAIALLHVG